jgi:hypothetical protein
MIYIQNNSQNQIWLGINEWSSLSNPTYLFQLQNSQGRDSVYFIPKNITQNYPNSYANKYVVFEFSTLLNLPQTFVATGNTPCNIYLKNENQYWLYIWEQTSPTNLNPALSYNKVFNELAFCFIAEDNVYYTGNTLNFADNVIYYSQPKPSGTPIPSQTPSPSQTPNPTSTPTSTPTPTPTPLPSFWNNTNILWNNNTNLWNN